MPSGLSIPTCLALAQSAPPAWLVWFTAPRDPPILVLLGCILLAFGLGRAARRR